MKNLSLHLILLSLALPFYALAQTVFIVVHGTWAANMSWCKPGGDFFSELKAGALPLDASVASFTWSGKLDNKSRAQAGKDLAQFIKSYPPTTAIHIVGHSHGANVGIIASQELAKIPSNEHKIAKLYALAAPVNTTQYMPAMNVIDQLYNFFSLYDYIQPVLGIFGRVFPEHPRIANIRVVLEGKAGSHSEMRDPLIGRWLPAIHELLTENYQGNFQHFAFGKPGVIYFFNQGNPYYKDDREQGRLLVRDRELLERLANVLTRQPQKVLA